MDHIEQNAVTVVDMPRTIVLHRIQESELRDLVDAHDTLLTNLQFLTAMAGLFVGFVTTLLTVTLSDRTFMVFCGLSLVSLVAGTYFGVNARRASRKVKQNIDRLLNNSSELR